MNMRLTIFFVCLWGLPLSPNAACAARQSLTANIAFDSIIMVTDKTDINFGNVLAEQPGAYTISTSGDVTATGSGLWLGGSTSPGSMTIIGSSTQSINIAVDNYVADNGAMPGSAVCSYDGGTPAPCSLSNLPPPAAGKVLALGLTMYVDGTQGIGTTASPSFEVIVNYN